MITREDIEKKTEELVEMIKQFEGSKSDAADYVCYEVVTWASDNHYEGVGILTECLLRWRNKSVEILEQEDEEPEGMERSSPS